MKQLIGLILCLASLNTSAAELFNIKSDKGSYIPNGKAILVTNITSLPQSPNFEVVVKSEVNDQAVEAIRLSDHQFISKVESVGSGSEVVFASKYYIRDKHEADVYQSAINVSDLKIFELIKARRSASAQERAGLDAEIAKEEGRITFYTAKMNGLLRLIEEKVLLAEVAAPAHLINNAFIFLTGDRESRIYHPGEKLTLFGHVYTQVFDKEPVVKVQMGSTPLKVEKLLNDEFVIQSEDFSVADIGTHEVVVQLYLRDKARSAKLVDALVSVEAEIVRLAGLLATEEDPAQQLALQNQIEKLTSTKVHIQSILLSLEDLVETVNYKIVVEDV